MSLNWPIVQCRRFSVPAASSCSNVWKIYCIDNDNCCPSGCIPYSSGLDPKEDNDCTACSVFTTQPNCTGAGYCEWCTKCGQLQNKHSSNSEDVCVISGTCVYTCAKGLCGADCSDDSDCPDECGQGVNSNKLTHKKCGDDCLCETDWEEDCTLSSKKCEDGACVPIVECNDGIDNDNDGKIDEEDAGCTYPYSEDNDESNCGDGECEGTETNAYCPNDCSAYPTSTSLKCRHYNVETGCIWDFDDECDDHTGGTVGGAFSCCAGFLCNDGIYKYSCYDDIWTSCTTTPVCPSNTDKVSEEECKCSDGTLYGRCSDKEANKGMKCEDGVLIDKCSECGCPPDGSLCNHGNDKCEISCSPSCQYSDVCDESAPDGCGGTCTRDTDGEYCGTNMVCQEGECKDEGVCTPGDTEPKSCGTDIGQCVSGTQIRTCGYDYYWGDWGGCGGTYVGPSTEICDGKDNN